MKAAGIYPCPQQAFIYDFGDAYVSVLGPERALSCYPIKTWFDLGFKPSTGSDAPVCEPNPFPNLYAMVTRKTWKGTVMDERERVSIEDALESIGERMASDDFKWVVMAIRIQREVGGNLAELLLQVAGTLRERDYLRRVAIEGRTERQTTVGEIMSSPLVYVTPETSVEECMAVMTERRIRHLPVLAAGNKVAGVISIGDLVKYTSKQQAFEIKYLTDYITGR